jgi:hypothetical protein
MELLRVQRQNPDIRIFFVVVIIVVIVRDGSVEFGGNNRKCQ